VASVALQSLVSQTADGKPLSTNNWAAVKVYASIQLKHLEYARVSRNHHSPAAAEVIAKPMSVGVTALSRLS